MSYVCAYSSVQLDKSRVEKEFTAIARFQPRVSGSDIVTVLDERDRLMMECRLKL